MRCCYQTQHDGRALFCGVQLTRFLRKCRYYAWQRQLFENGSLAFERRNSKNRHQPNRDQKKIAALEETLQKRNEVVAELLQEHVQLKKEVGES